MRKYSPLIWMGIGMSVLVGLSAWHMQRVWDECRETHSFEYCFHTVMVR